MRIPSSLFFLFLLIQFSFARVAPRVPETIEIANVRLKLTSEARSDIQKEVDALQASDKFFQIKLDRINLYFPIMEKVLKEEGVPDDLKYLAVQESSLVSDAVSTSDAVGYWQFKDFTAREVGLRVDSKIDERKNIVSASHGAAKYFKRNNYYFRNWIYCVSAYQAGPAGAKKYVDERYYGSDKLTIDRNTHWYVKRFIAHVIAFRDEVGGPHSEGLRLLVYDRGENKELKEIAREFKVEEQDLAEFNKWLRNGTIPSDKPYSVIIPVKGKVKSADYEVEQPLTRTIAEPKDRSSGAASVANNGVVPILLNGREALLAGASDDVNSLAQKGAILPRQLLKYNDLPIDGDIQPGLTYYIQSKRNKSEIAYHTVQRNETLWSISQKYGVKLKALIKMNRLENPEDIQLGQEIWMNKKRAKAVPVEIKEIKEPMVVQSTPVTEGTSQTFLILREKPNQVPVSMQNDSVKIKNAVEPTLIKKVEAAPAKVEVVKPTGTNIYSVKPGETLWSIAKAFDLTVQELCDMNDMKKDDPLKPGQELKVKKESFKLHKVAPGDTFYSISKKFNMTVDELKKLNDKQDTSLSIGEELKVRND